MQTISGGATPTVGVPLHVDQGGTWGVGTPTVTFHWRVDKVVVGHGADDTPQPAEAGSRIDVVGHYDRVGYETHAISTVMARAIQPGAAPTLSRAPVLTGAARYAGRSRVLPGTCSLAGERSYQRLRDGTAVKHATKRAYRLRKVDRRHRVTLGVRALRSGYADGSWRLKAVRVR